MDFTEFVHDASVICESLDMRFAMLSTPDITRVNVYAKKPHPLMGEPFISHIRSVGIYDHDFDLRMIHEMCAEVNEKMREKGY